MSKQFSPDQLGVLESDPRRWLSEFAPPFKDAASGSGQPQCVDELLEWIGGLNANVRPDPMAFGRELPSDGGSLDAETIIEWAILWLGATGRRKFCLYVSPTKSQAEERVRNIKYLLDESYALAANYPDLVEPARRPDGRRISWSKRDLRCASGLVVRAKGLRQAQHTSRVDGQRPDLIVFDNITIKRRSKALLPQAVYGYDQRRTAFLVLNDPDARDGLAGALAGGTFPNFLSLGDFGKCR